MAKYRTTSNQTITLLVGFSLFFFGIAVMFGTILEDTSIWLPAVLIFAGLFTLPTVASPHGDPHDENRHEQEKIRGAEKHSRSATLVAIALLLIGAYLIFREIGIIDAPVLRYLFGGGMALTGLYGIVTSSVWIFKHAGKPTAPTPPTAPPLSKTM